MPAGICRSCYNKAHLTICVRCGERGTPTVREPGGTICSRCAAQCPSEHSDISEPLVGVVGQAGLMFWQCAMMLMDTGSGSKLTANASAN